MLQRICLWKIALGVGGALLIGIGNSKVYAFPGDGTGVFADMGLSGDSEDFEETSTQSSSSATSSNVFDDETETSGPQGVMSLSALRENSNTSENSRRSDVQVMEDQGGREMELNDLEGSQTRERRLSVEELREKMQRRAF